jgi:hypothetical protein
MPASRQHRRPGTRLGGSLKQPRQRVTANAERDGNRKYRNWPVLPGKTTSWRASCGERICFRETDEGAQSTRKGVVDEKPGHEYSGRATRDGRAMPIPKIRFINPTWISGQSRMMYQSLVPKAGGNNLFLRGQSLRGRIDLLTTLRHHYGRWLEMSIQGDIVLYGSE